MYPKSRFLWYSVVFLCLLWLSPSVLTIAKEPAQSTIPAAPWTTLQGNSYRQGRSSFTGITDSPELRWRIQLPANCGETAQGMVQAEDGDVYVAACQYLSRVALDGTVKWSYNVQDEELVYSRSVPTIAEDGTLYWGSGDSVIALSPTGERLWSVSGLSLNYVFGSSPVLGPDGHLYVVHDAMFSFTTDGELRWVHPYGGWFSHSSPAAGEDGTIYAGANGFLYAYTTNGKIRWQRKIGTADSPAIGDDGTIYSTVSGGSEQGGKLYAFSPEGEQRWIFVTEEAWEYGAETAGPPAIGLDGTVYFGTSRLTGVTPFDSHFYAVHPDGELKWKFTLPRMADELSTRTASPPVVDIEGNVYFCAIARACYGLNENGELLWTYSLDPATLVQTSPFIAANGSIWIMDVHARLYNITNPPDQIFLPLVQSHPVQ